MAGWLCGSHVARCIDNDAHSFLWLSRCVFCACAVEQKKTPLHGILYYHSACDIFHIVFDKYIYGAAERRIRAQRRDVSVV